MSAIAGLLASNNSLVIEKGEMLLEDILTFDDNPHLFQSLVNAITYGNSRAQPFLLDKLLGNPNTIQSKFNSSFALDKLPVLYERYPNVAKKYVFRLSFKMMDTTKKSVRERVYELIQLLYEYFEDEYLEIAPSNKLKKVRAIIKDT